MVGSLWNYFYYRERVSLEPSIINFLNQWLWIFPIIFLSSILHKGQLWNTQADTWFYYHLA